MIKDYLVHTRTKSGEHNVTIYSSERENELLVDEVLNSFIGDIAIEIVDENNKSVWVRGGFHV